MMGSPLIPSYWKKPVTTAIISDPCQTFANGAWVDFALILDRLDQQAEGVVGQSRHGVGLFAVGINILADEPPNIDSLVKSLCRSN